MREVMPVNKSGMKFIEKGGIKSGNQVYLCQCPRCGRVVEMYAAHYYRGSSSCHCIDSRNNRLYRIWTNMKSRCNNPNFPSYRYYGARGIKVCDEWKDNFLIFESWALANGYRDDLSLDRVDNNGNYEPSNCRWATLREQAGNKSNNVMITINGETKHLREWCRYLNLNYKSEHSFYSNHGLDAWIEKAQKRMKELKINEE